MKGFVKNSKYLLLHLAAMAGVTVALVLVIFYYYLPHVTKHGERITMPNLVGMHLDEVGVFLRERHLTYKVSPDSAYEKDEPPLTVRKQFPSAHSKIKEDREIQLVLNATVPPMVRMPNLLDGSLKNAIFLLEARHLTLGEMRYVSDLAEDAVLGQYYKKKEIAAASYIPRGSTIDLVVGGGLGGKRYQTPKVAGLTEYEAKIIILGLGLKIKTIHYTDEESTEQYLAAQASPYVTWPAIATQKDVVYDQHPRETVRVKEGSYVELWVYKPSGGAPGLFQHEGTGTETQQEDEEGEPSQ